MKVRYHVGIGLGSSVLGLVVGVAVDANYHPNYMRVWINPINELSLAPQEDDIIQWTVQGAPDQGVSLDFGTNIANIPCQPGPTGVGVCVVHYPTVNGVYQYKCISGGSQICDPNLGPSSGTGPGMMGAYKYLKVLLKNIGRSFTHRKYSLTDQGGPVAGPRPAFNAPMRAGASVACTSQTNGTTQVTPEGQDADSPIAIAPGGKILWQSPAGSYGSNGFSLSLPSGLCSSFNKGLCIVDSGITKSQNFSYTAQVTASACAVSNQEVVQVQVSSPAH